MADITISTTMFLSTVGGLVGAIALLFRLLIASKDKAIADSQSCREIAEDAVRIAREMTNRNRVVNGLDPVNLDAPVVDVATLRASVAKISLAAGLESPRKKPERGNG